MYLQVPVPWPLCSALCLACPLCIWGAGFHLFLETQPGLGGALRALMGSSLLQVPHLGLLRPLCVPSTQDCVGPRAHVSPLCTSRGDS